MVCALFGHRNVSGDIKAKLENTVIDLIENHNVNTFYIGNNGDFDRMGHYVLDKLSGKYDYKYYVVLAYLPVTADMTNSEITIYPEGIECVPQRFAISQRNKWMVDNSDYILCCVYREGGACKAMKRGLNQGKMIINLAE